jgi:hypothetical protein
MSERPDLPVLDQDRWDIPLDDVLEDLRDDADDAIDTLADHETRIAANTGGLSGLSATVGAHSVDIAGHAERIGILESEVPSAGPNGAVWTGTGSAAYWTDRATGARVYNPDTTVHFVGDIHVGLTDTPARHDAAFKDFAAINPLITHRVYLGDLQDTPGDAGQRTTIAQRLASAGLRSNYDLVLGNHDIYGSGTANMLTYGYGARNWIRDLPFVRLIGITLNALGYTDGAWMTFYPDDLAFLDASLGSTELPCVICFHAPLYNTTSIGPLLATHINFHARPDADIRAILKAHDNAYMWVSGHTHTTTADPKIFQSEDLGDGRSILTLNTSAIAYVGGMSTLGSPLYSPLVTFDPGRATVRWRDHANAQFVAVGGKMATDLPPVPSVASDPITLVLSPDGSTGPSGAITPAVAGGISAVAGKIGNAWDVPAGGDGIVVTGASTYISGTDGSVVFWINFDGALTVSAMAYFGNGGPTSLSIQRNGTALQINHRGANNIVSLLALPSANLAGPGWRCIYVGWSTTTLEASIDASIIAVNSALSDTTGAISGDIRLGRGFASGTSIEGLFGPLIANSRRLTQEEVTHMYYRTAPWARGMLAP